jgi:hypothetical protein
MVLIIIIIILLLLLNHNPFCDDSAKVECEQEDVLSCYKEILQTEMQAGTKQVYEIQIIQAGASRFQCMHTHTECKVIVIYTLDGSNSCELKVLMY